MILDAPTDSTEHVVTGSIATDILGPVEAGRSQVVMAWPLGEEGRRLWAGHLRRVAKRHKPGSPQV